MSAYPLLLHTVASLWYVFFWNNFLAAGQTKSKEWDPKYRDIQEMGYRFLTNWNLVNQFIFSFILLASCSHTIIITMTLYNLILKYL